MPSNYIIISITFYLFQLFTIYSAVSIFVFLAVVVQYRSGGRGGSAIGLVIYTAAILALLYIGYYLWDIVKSAYKQIKEENENVHPAGNYMMNTYGKSPPPQYNDHVWICKS